ncbi:MAG: hypothetical protein ACTSVU_05725 [Promethearchaeota archaeon]
MFFLQLSLADWGMDKYKLVLQLVSVVVIVAMLVYIALSSRES